MVCLFYLCLEEGYLMKWSYENVKLEQTNDVNDQTRGEIFKQAAKENIYPPNTISACRRIRDERKLHNEDNFIGQKSTIFLSYLQF